MLQSSAVNARPFLKWAGGKRQLLPQIKHYLPTGLEDGTIRRYVEPFIGSGAIFFYIAQTYQLSELYIADLNPDLIIAYRTVRLDVEGLIHILRDLERDYLALSPEGRKRFYYQIRTSFNANRLTINYDLFATEWVTRTAELIFLNRTCYNGLFRVNSQGAFNVPAGRYHNPTICDAPNLRAVSSLLKHVNISTGGYDACLPLVDERTFVYFDPPYRPLSQTANFTAYSRANFTDTEQLELAAFFRSLDSRGARLLLSNSDPKNNDPDDDFFEIAYEGFHLSRIHATRRINSKTSGRGPLHELLIFNYQVG